MTNASTPFRVAAKATPTPSVDWGKAPAALRTNLLDQLVKNEKHHTARLVPQWWKEYVKFWDLDTERTTEPGLILPLSRLMWIVISGYVVQYPSRFPSQIALWLVMLLLALFVVWLHEAIEDNGVSDDRTMYRFLCLAPTPIAIWLAFKEIYARALFAYKRTVYNGDMEMAEWSIEKGIAHLEAAMKPILDEHQTAYTRFTALRKTWTTQVDECETNRKRHESQAQTHNANKETYLAQAMRKSAQEQLDRAKTYQRLIDALSLLLGELDNRIREFAGLHKQQLLPLAKHLHHLKTKEALVPTDTTEAELRARMVTLHSEIQSLVMQAQEVAEGRVYTRIESATEQADPVLVEAQRDVENLLKKRS